MNKKNIALFLMLNKFAKRFYKFRSRKREAEERLTWKKRMQCVYVSGGGRGMRECEKGNISLVTAEIIICWREHLEIWQAVQCFLTIVCL